MTSLLHCFLLHDSTHSTTPLTTLITHHQYGSTAHLLHPRCNTWPAYRLQPACCSVCVFAAVYCRLLWRRKRSLWMCTCGGRTRSTTIQTSSRVWRSTVPRYRNVQRQHAMSDEDEQHGGAKPNPVIDAFDRTNTHAYVTLGPHPARAENVRNFSRALGFTETGGKHLSKINTVLYLWRNQITRMYIFAHWIHTAHMQWSITA